MAVAIIDTLKIFEKLKDKFNDSQAKAVVEVIESALENYKESQKEFLATKDDVYKLEKKIEETKYDLLKWFIVMWTTLIIAMGIFKFL